MKKKAKAKPQVLEMVLTALRRGHAIRRRAWLDNARLEKLGRLVYLTSNHTERWVTPLAWRPFAEDLLANDWEVVK